MRALAAAAALAAVPLLGACAGAPAATTPAPAAAPPATAEALAEAMRSRYAGKWYRTLTFVQRTLQTPPSGGREVESTWYETMQLPGRLRIDLDSTLRTGRLFANDSTYAVVNGALRAGVPGHNALLVLGFDVYGQPASRTAAVLRTLGFPDGPVRAGTFEGRPVWIVGGGPGPTPDARSAQWWVDQERLVFVRLIQPWPGDTTKAFDARFLDYRPLAGGWIAPLVEAYVDGKRVLREEYRDVRADVAVDPVLFEPRRWTEGRHWARR